MSVQDIVYESIYDVAHFILDEDEKPALVIQAFGEGNPVPPYLSIQLPSMREVGSPEFMEIGSSTATEQTVRNDYEGYTNLYEMGNNDMIRTLLSRINDPDVLDLLDSLGLSIFVDGEIVDTPRLVGSVYDKQLVCRIGLAFSVEHQIAAQTSTKMNITGQVSNQFADYDINLNDTKE